MKDTLAKAGFVIMAFPGSHLVLICSSHTSRCLPKPRLTWFFLLFLLYNFHGLSHCDLDRLSHTSLHWGQHITTWMVNPTLPPARTTLLPFWINQTSSVYAGPLNACSRNTLLEVSEHQNQLQLAAILGQGCLLCTSPSLCQCD